MPSEVDLIPIVSEPALYYSAEKTIIASDLHFGFESEMLRSGIWVPNRSQKRTERMIKIIKDTGAKRLVLLGDVKHKVPFSNFQERKDLDLFFSKVCKLVEVSIVPGNHDGGLQNLAPEQVNFYPSEGFILGGIGLHHGHAWPSKDLMKCNVLVMGHNHPVLTFKDRIGKLQKEPCWVRAPMISHKRYDNIPDTLIILPAFAELAGRAINKIPLSGLGPLIKNGLVDLEKARIESLEGLDFGELKHLTDLKL